MLQDVDIVISLSENHKCCTIAAMNYAAAGGHLDIIKWLSHNRSEGCTTKAIVYAERNGHMNISKWLYNNNSNLNIYKLLMSFYYG